MKRRTYKPGRDTGRFRKGERVTELAQVKAGDLLIKDSHRFGATNLVKVESVRWLPVGFNFQYARPDGSVIERPLFFTHEFELTWNKEMFYKAVK